MVTIQQLSARQVAAILVSALAALAITMLCAGSAGAAGRHGSHVTFAQAERAVDKQFAKMCGEITGCYAYGASGCVRVNGRTIRCFGHTEADIDGGHEGCIYYPIFVTRRHGHVHASHWIEGDCDD